jgi:GT2 family glycosyltransferase
LVGDVVVLVDAGVVVGASAVAAMCGRVGVAGVGAVGCAVVDGRGRVLDVHRRLPGVVSRVWGSRVGAWVDRRWLGGRFAERAVHADVPRVGVMSVGQVSTRCVALRRETVVGPLAGVLVDESVPVGRRELDLSLRLAGAGLGREVLWDEHVVFDPDSGSAGSGSAGSGGAGGSGGVVTSVVIPAYNYGAYIGEAIDSALGQTAGGVEVVVVDDGSTDDTAAVVAGYVAGYGDRVRVHRQVNSGVSVARNVGARLARGRFVAFLDADNRLAPTFVERCVAALEATPTAGFAYTQLAHFGAVERVTELPPYSLDQLLDTNTIDVCSLVRRELVTRHGFDEGHRTLEDWDFWLTLAGHGWGGTLVDEPLVDYRRHVASKSTTRSRPAARRARLRILWRHRRLVGYRRVYLQLRALVVGFLRRR